MSDFTEEVKCHLDEQKKAFEEFKKLNDNALEQKASKGDVDTLLKSALDKVNKEITDQQKAMDDLLKKQGRLAAATAGESTVEETEHKEGFDRFLRKGDDTGLSDLQTKAMTIGSDPDGGYFVPTEIEQGVDGLARATSSIMALATQRATGTGNYKKRVRTSGAGYTWAGETQAPTESTTPQYAELAFEVKKIQAEPQISSDLLEDAEYDLESDLQEQIELDMSEGIAQSLLLGDGIMRPRGLLTYDTVANANWAWGKIGYVASGSAGAFAASDPADALIDLVHALKSTYRTNANFLLNDLTLATARKFKDGQDNYLWQPSIQVGAPSLLLGYPVFSDDFMPDVAADSLSIAFGDIARTYLVLNRRGVSVLRDPYTAKPYVKYFTTKRIGGGVQHFESVKMMKFAAS